MADAAQQFYDFAREQRFSDEYCDTQAYEALIQVVNTILSEVFTRRGDTKRPFKESPAYQLASKAPAEKKIALLTCLITLEAGYQPPEEYFKRHPHVLAYMRKKLLDNLMRGKIEFPADFSFYALFRLLYQLDNPQQDNSLDSRLFTAFVMLLEKHAKRAGVNDVLIDDLRQILDHPLLKTQLSGEGYSSWAPDIGKAAKKLQQLLMTRDVVPYEFGSSLVGTLMANSLAQLDSEQQSRWNRYFHQAASASGAKPTAKFINAINPLIDDIGLSAFKRQVNQWLINIASINAEEKGQVVHLPHGRQYVCQGYEFIAEHCFDVLKGLLWSLSRFHDYQTLSSVSSLAERCFRGQVAGVGNAAIYTLAQSKGLDGISHLSRLKLRIRQNNTQKLIQKYIEEQAAKQGITAAQVEEIAAPDFGLAQGERVALFDDYRLVLRHSGVGAAELQWFKPDGKPQKSVPAFVKDSQKHSAVLKKMRDLAKQVKQASTTQRDRIDRLYLEQMSWQRENFCRYYLNHGLVSLIARQLIWNLDGVAALFYDGQWSDVAGQPLSFDHVETITLWHPLDSEAEEVLRWRERLEQLQIRQPIKQAYREIYVLTDAEINTRVYSNRMAAHILKQHQFNSLAALRGWKYSLMGAYDDGREGEIASKQLPAYNMQAQFWINEILDDHDNFNDVGIWHYVATDQLRFCDADDQPLPLVDIPPLVLSEVMRDLDLFVGVASVGNDPQWQDGGPDGRPTYRDYWQSYSFGDLTEVAKTRKAVLERLLPRLKIRDQVSIDGKFLHVCGSRHRYKIHIGSGNILIAPQDRYLCIVPGRGKDKNVEQVFLPFEGDSGLSIVLSKAFLLAADDKITDPTILSQL